MQHEGTLKEDLAEQVHQILLGFVFNNFPKITYVHLAHSQGLTNHKTDST